MLSTAAAVARKTRGVRIKLLRVGIAHQGILESLFNVAWNSFGSTLGIFNLPIIITYLAGECMTTTLFYIIGLDIANLDIRAT